MTQRIPLEAGAARADITPDDLAGLNPFGGVFTGVHDPIHLRALAVRSGDGLGAIVAADLIEVGETDEVRARIERELGIPADRIMIAPSHSHNAPRVGFVTPGGKARIPTPESLAFTRVVDDALVSVLGRALATMRPARIAAAHGSVDVNVSREAYLDGRWGLGWNPDGDSDKDLGVVAVETTDGDRIAVLLDYAVHSTIALGVPQLSADLAGAASAYVERELGGDVVTLWLSGALGDQAPRISLGEPTGDPDRDAAFAFRAVEAQGVLLGAEAVRVLAGIERWREDVDVTGGRTVLALPARRLPVPPGMEQADVPTVDLALSYLRIGDLAFAGVSGEVTVPVHRAIRRALPLKDTFLVSNVNARIGYLPTDESYDRRTQAADGCPIVQGHGQRSIVEGLAALADAAR